MNVLVYKSFEEVPAEVRGRFSYPAEPNFFLSFDWFLLLFETSLRQRLTPRIYVLMDVHDTPVGALFCGVEQGSGMVKRLLSLTNFYTMEYAPLQALETGARPAVVKELVQFIAHERPRWHVVLFSLMKTDVPEVREMLSELSKAGFSPNLFFQYDNWFLPAGGKTFQSYFAERPSQVRNTITRKQQKLAKTHKFEIKVVNGESADLEVVTHDWIAIYNRSWKNPEPFPDFIPTFVSLAARLGVLRLGLLYVDDKPAAGQLWITTKTKTLIYKLSYDEEYRDLGVGSILSKELFRIAIDEDKVEEIDYGVGSEAYKKDWMSSARRIEGVEAFNRRTPIGLLLASIKSTKAAIKRRYPRISE